ncbi:MAG TPA: hypothetical protein PKD38_02980 [Nitrospira sp.]|nr:hypothetical protein [Nitrospira sp.]
MRQGLPFPRGLVADVKELIAIDEHGQAIPAQFDVLARWPDRSVKWMVVDALIDVAPHETTTIRIARAPASTVPQTPSIAVSEDGDGLKVDTGVAVFVLRRGERMISCTRRESTLSYSHAEARMERGNEGYHACIDQITVEEQGPVRASLLGCGRFVSGTGSLPLDVSCRWVFHAGSACVRLEFCVRNPQPAEHFGGLWDLGDGGSVEFTDLSIMLQTSAPVDAVTWKTANPTESARQRPHSLCLYQDSSGGSCWNSPNHVDNAGQSTVSFSGFRVAADSASLDHPLESGSRATPCIWAAWGDESVAFAVADFWQNFPKALRAGNGGTSVALFPRECRAGFELQGGEQKRHTIFLEFGAVSGGGDVLRAQHPLQVSLNPKWVEATGAIAWFSAAAPEDDTRYADYVKRIIGGDASFFVKREKVDEYGWRHFGDLYADHEAVLHSGPHPMASHYNNQYDFILAAGIQFLRTAAPEWRYLMADAARHCVDIDIYHTDGDRAAYNGGLFWHTDHYMPAATSTHRTYSGLNGGKGYGGGPSNEHNYTSGLLLYYYLSGDRDAGQAVVGLADWVRGMDDGSETLLGMIDPSPTGLASMTVDADFHGPGRGAGNSINALMDAYRISGARLYLAKAEELLERCIHPNDHIDSFRLDDAEYRWSYLVFLQIVGKYLNLKRELGEIDYHYCYARESLLAYASWMDKNERPYKEILDRVLIPTETWPAQDIRKCHVFDLAAEHSSGPIAARFSERSAFYFDRCIDDLLSFPTAQLTRPMVIVAGHGWIHEYFRRVSQPPPVGLVHNYDFGRPSGFVRQRRRVARELRRRIAVVRKEGRRLVREKWCELRRRLSGRP